MCRWYHGTQSRRKMQSACGHTVEYLQEMHATRRAEVGRAGPARRSASAHAFRQMAQRLRTSLIWRVTHCRDHADGRDGARPSSGYVQMCLYASKKKALSKEGLSRAGICGLRLIRFLELRETTCPYGAEKGHAQDERRSRFGDGGRLNFVAVRPHTAACGPSTPLIR